MKKILALLAFVLFASTANAQSITPGEQDVLVKNIETYMNGITTLKARFSQQNQDGTLQTGNFYLKRPGRLRFEYDVPAGGKSADYIVADGLLVHYWDDGIKNYSNLPIGSTLADFLLRKKISFTGDLTVVSLKRPRQNKLVLTLVQTKHREFGDLRLLLLENPWRLEKWRVTDGTGIATEVTLTDVKTDITLDPRLFVFKVPKGYEREMNQN